MTPPKKPGMVERALARQITKAALAIRAGKQIYKDAKKEVQEEQIRKQKLKIEEGVLGFLDYYNAKIETIPHAAAEYVFFAAFECEGLKPDQDQVDRFLRIYPEHKDPEQEEQQPET